MNLVVAIFLLFLISTLAITFVASRRSGTREDFYLAGRSIGGVRNGFAFAGDFLSAAAFLGVAGLYFSAGFDGLIYGLGALIGWPVLLFLLAEKLRRLGRYTFADVLTINLAERPVRVFSACANLLVLTFYMLSQMVGAGLLIKLLFGVSFGWSALGVGALMLIYVVFGGMIATTWVQVIKAALLLAVTTVLAVWVMWRSGFDFDALLESATQAHPSGSAILAPGRLIPDLGGALSLALTLIFGPAGLPHVLMRFFTVPDVAAARRSACVATVLIGFFSLLMIVVGFGTIKELSGNPSYVDSNGALLGGGNMAALLLARALGGEIFMGVVAAIAFATILAVVAGLTMAAATSISHDLYAVFRRTKPTESQELRVSRWGALAFGLTGIGLSILFQNENVTLLSATAMSIAASSTFPVLMLALFWPRLTTSGAIAGGLTGLVSAVVGIVIGPLVWVPVLGYSTPIFPFQYPTLVSLPLALIVATLTSLRAKRQ